MEKKTVVGLIGRPGVGKDTVADMLIEMFGGEKFSFSRVLIDEYCATLGIAPTHPNLQYIGDAIRPEWLHDRAKEHIQNLEGDFLVIPSIRRQADLDFIKNFPHHVLVSIEVDERQAFERMKKRGEKPGEEFLTWEEYQKLLSAPIDHEIPSLQKQTEKKIQNNGSLEELRKQVEKIFEAVRNE